MTGPLARRIAELEGEVERLRKQNSDWVPKFEGMRPTENGVELTTTEAHEVLLGMTEAMATALGDAENYVEAEVQAAGEPRYIFTVRRYGKPTPHELRRQAEAERDDLAAANVELRNELHSLLGRARRYSGPLSELHAQDWWHVGRECDGSSVACEAARWKAEQDEVARVIEERGRG